MIFVCNHCLKSLAVLTDPQSMPLLEEEDVYSCPWCGEGELRHHPVLAKAAQEHPGTFQLEVMKVEDFYRAVRGMGLPGEYGADPELVTALFRVGRVKALELEEVGQPKKTLLHAIHIATGDTSFTLHLGPSAHGAVVYRITENGHGSRQATDGGDPSGRAQAGPAPAPPSGGGGAPADAGADGLPGVQGAGPVQE